MKTYDELKALIEQRGVHAEFGDAGEGWGIEQNSHELATFLTRMQELGVTSCLEIGTGYKGGLSRFLAHDMGWAVTSLDINTYHHVFEGVHYLTLPDVNSKLRINNDFDLVFIDGNHNYDFVVSDYNMYRFFATRAIAFHDILGFRECEGVERFWQELLFTEGWQRADVATSPDIRTASGIGWIEL